MHHVLQCEQEAGLGRTATRHGDATERREVCHDIGAIGMSSESRRQGGRGQAILLPSGHCHHHILQFLCETPISDKGFVCVQRLAYKIVLYQNIEKRTLKNYCLTRDVLLFLTQAVTSGMLRLSRLLVDVRPSFLNESWVRQEVLPLALYHRPDFTEWLFREAASPRKLKLLCRARILRSVGARPCACVKQLPLPSRLLTFLELSEHFPASIYRERPFVVDRCPYACAPNCCRRQCRHLDFSDSASSSDG